MLHFREQLVHLFFFFVRFVCRGFYTCRCALRFLRCICSQIHDSVNGGIQFLDDSCLLCCTIRQGFWCIFHLWCIRWYLFCQISDLSQGTVKPLQDIQQWCLQFREIAQEIRNVITISGQVTLCDCLYLHRDLADIICQNTHGFFQIPDGTTQLILRLIGKHFYVGQFALAQAGNCCLYLFYRLCNGIGNDPSDQCCHYSNRKTRCHDHNKYDDGAYIGHGLCPV